MRNRLSKKCVRLTLILVFIGFALTALTGCGINHGSYRHGYDRQADYYENGHGYAGNTSNFSRYSHGDRGYGTMMRNGYNRSGYCSR